MPAKSMPAKYCVIHKKNNMVDVLGYPSDVWDHVSSVTCTLRAVTENLTMKIYVRKKVSTNSVLSQYQLSTYLVLAQY